MKVKTAKESELLLNVLFSTKLCSIRIFLNLDRSAFFSVPFLFVVFIWFLFVFLSRNIFSLFSIFYSTFVGWFRLFSLVCCLIFSRDLELHQGRNIRFRLLVGAYCFFCIRYCASLLHYHIVTAAAVRHFIHIIE